MQGMNRDAFVGPEMGATVGSMAIGAVGRRSKLESAGPVRRRIRELMAAISQTERGAMTTGATDGGTVVGETDGVVDLDAVIAVLGGEVIVGDVAGLVGMTGVAWIGGGVVGSDLTTGITAGGGLVTGNNTGGEAGGEGAVAVAALGAGTVLGGSTPLALPNPFVSMATDEGAVRTAGWSGAAELVESHGKVGLGAAQDPGLVGTRRRRRVAGGTGSSGSATLRYLEQIIVGISGDGQGAGMEAAARSGANLATDMAIETDQ